MKALSSHTTEDNISINGNKLQQQTKKAIWQKIQRDDLKKMPHPPVITGVYVAALARPDFLLEMDAVAVIPE
ncbi:MAG TPA: hypothetical protein VK666_26060 [Chryseolinea sp.]|nr:hypothetical protein [Chryseolinea sp.]